ncbi:hypothetical protein D9M68_637410 [compost metagenome]
MLANEVAGQIIGEPGRLYRGLVLGVGAVEEGRAVAVKRVTGIGQRRIPVVATEQLVGALAALHHLAVLRDFAGQQVEGDAVMADHRLAHGREGCRELIQHLVLVDAQLLMTCAVVVGDQVGEFELIAAFAAGILETDGEGGQLLDAGLGQQAHQQAGVHSTGKQDAHFASGTLADTHGLAQAAQQGIAPVLQAEYLFVFAGAVLQLPPGAIVAIASGIEHHPAGRRQLFHALDQSAWRRHHSMEVEVEVQRLRIQRGVQVATLEQGWQAGGEAQAPIGARQVQGLDAEAVASEKQPLAVALPNGQGKHAVEPGQHVLAPGVPGLEQYLGIPVGKEAVTEALEFDTQLWIVIDGTIEDHG